MAKPLVSDELWAIIQPLLPPPRPRRSRFPGRKPIDDRRCLTGILFVLKTGIGWEDRPAELGCGSGMTCWRRLRDWNAAGVWDKLHRVLLERLHGAEKIDWSRAVIDSASVRAVSGGADRAEPHRPRQGGLEAPRPDRRRRPPAGRPDHRRQPPRRHPARRPGRGRPPGGGPARPAPAAARRAVRGPGLRLAAAPRLAAGAGDHAAAGPPGRGARQRPGPGPLGGGADAVLAAPEPPAARPVR